MGRVASLLFCSFLLLLGLAAGQGSAPPPWAASRPLPEPAVFAEGTISTGEYESHPAFTPDGRTLFFLKSTPDFQFWTIVVSRFTAGRWSPPETAPFSGRYADADPFVTADGAKLYFISNRPADGKPDGKPKEDLDIWMVERRGDGWGEPRNLGEPVNSAGNEWYPTLAADGTLYFGSDRPGGKGRTDLYRAKPVDGSYASPENLGDAVNTPGEEFEPWISPAQDVLIFMSVRRDGLGSGDLYLSRFAGGAWTPARNLGPPINSSASEYSPKLSPDGRYFFFASSRGFGAEPLDRRLTYPELARKLGSAGNGLGDIYRVDASAVLDGKPRPGAQI